MSLNTTNTTADERLRDLGIDLPQPPTPLGAYVEAVQTGKLLFLSGTLPLEGGIARFVGRIGGELSVEDGRRATELAALNALAAAREHLGSLDRVTRVVRLSVSLATTTEFRQHPRVADAASELLATIFGADRTSTRMVCGVASLPLGVCVVVEIILEVYRSHQSDDMVRRLCPASAVASQRVGHESEAAVTKVLPRIDTRQDGSVGPWAARR